MQLAWGARVTSEFADKVVRVSERLECDPDHLMACMAFETGRTFSPSVRNPSSTATGLIQFMAATAKGLGTTVGELAQMTAVEQLDWVEQYFRPYAGKLNSLADVYAAIIWPVAVGKPDDYVLFREGDPAYAVNKGLDVDKRGTVTKIEAAAKVARLLEEGLRPGNVGHVGEQPAAPIIEAGRSYNPEQDSPQFTPAEPPDEQVGAKALSEAPATAEGATKPMTPFLIGPILQLVPELIKLFGKGERATQNAKAAELVVQTFTEAVPGAVNAQDAIEKAQANPDVAKQARNAVMDSPAILALQEVGGGIPAARLRDDVAMAQPSWWRPLVTPSFIVAILLLLGTAFVLWHVTTSIGVWRTEDRSQVLMLAVAVISGVMGYYLGSSLGSANKDKYIERQ